MFVVKYFNATGANLTQTTTKASAQAQVDSCAVASCSKDAEDDSSEGQNDALWEEFIKWKSQMAKKKQQQNAVVVATPSHGNGKHKAVTSESIDIDLTNAEGDDNSNSDAIPFDEQLTRSPLSDALVEMSQITEMKKAYEQMQNEKKKKQQAGK